MGADKKSSIHLKIPFYRQHYQFTCGPASLMMAMKFLDTSLPLRRDLEVDLWREGNLVAVWGTSRYGLAFSASVRGFSTRVTSNTGGMDFVDEFVPSLNDADREMLQIHFIERRSRCRRLGVRERQEPITDTIISTSLSRGHVPLILTNSIFFNKEDLPHWVTVTGIDDKFLYLNNPLDIHPVKWKIEVSVLKRFIGYHDNQSMVEVWKPVQMR